MPARREKLAHPADTLKRIDRALNVIRGILEPDTPPEVTQRTIEAVKSVADLVTSEFINLALYCESPQVQLAAIKFYYTMIGIDPSARKTAKPEVTAEKIINLYMSTDTEEEDALQLAERIKEDASSDRDKLN